ncbi:hypothetical protein [Burkholderia sp. PU8-34]
MSSPNVHSAAGSALGYQVVYALRLLLLDYEDASVSIESWDDVYLEKSDRRELYQQKIISIRTKPMESRVAAFSVLGGYGHLGPENAGESAPGYSVREPAADESGLL